MLNLMHFCNTFLVHRLTGRDEIWHDEMTGIGKQQVLSNFDERRSSFTVHTGFKYSTGGSLWRIELTFPHNTLFIRCCHLANGATPCSTCILLLMHLFFVFIIFIRQKTMQKVVIENCG